LSSSAPEFSLPGGVVFARFSDEIEVRTEEGCPKLGSQFLSGMTLFTKPIVGCNAKARVKAAPMRAFVRERYISGIDADESLKR
jgi:hypothetical protein